MTEKRFIFLDGFSLRYTCICDNQKGYRTNGVLKQDEVLELLNQLHEENEQLKEENNKLHTKIFEMRTNTALERTEISKQPYTGKKNKKEYLDVKEFLDELEKW